MIEAETLVEHYFANELSTGRDFKTFMFVFVEQLVVAADLLLRSESSEWKHKELKETLSKAKKLIHKELSKCV